MSYVFGPVPSRRLGNSLGVDLVTFKACSFDCIYCQLGRTTDHRVERGRFVPAEAVIAEVKKVLASGAAVDYVTMSGSGEPTLSVDIGRIIRAVKESSDIPVAVLTNASLLWREDVREELAAADLMVPSFDAATQEVFERVNRPTGVDAATVARGIREFTQGYAGQVWLEVMVVAGVNDSDAEAEAIVRALAGARVDRVQLNTVARAPAEVWVQPVGEERLDALADVLGAVAPVDVIHHYSRAGHTSYRADVSASILDTLARRPCGTAELAASLGLAPNLVIKHIGELEREGKIERVTVGEATQYRARQP